MKILVVEDEKRIADSLKKGLELEGFSVDVVYDGNKGFDLASTGEYSLLILDLMLPGQDGLQVTSSLRSLQSNVPILILTAKGQVSDRVLGLNSGADDYLVKPFSFEELVSRVRALLRRPGKINDEIVSINDISMDKSSFTVTRSNTRIPLSHHEFVLLSFLIKMANRIVSKEQIISHVWHFDSDILPNTVEATIKNLRKKIEKPFPNKPPIISTHRGLGYQIKTHV